MICKQFNNLLRQVALILITVPTWTTAASANWNPSGPYLFQNPVGEYLALEVWQDNLIHFEYGYTPTKKFSSAKIWVSPMVDTEHLSHMQSQQITWISPNLVETARIRAEIDPSTLCVTSWRRSNQELLQKVCPQRLAEAWKGLAVFSPGARNVFGLGQYFKNPGTASGDWLGEVWDPLSYTMGNSLRPFMGGANSYALFPIAYVLGEGTSAYGIFLDHVYKQMWSLNQSPWKVDTFGDQIRWFLLEEESPMKLRQLYMQLTGRPPVPPKSVFGLWLSEFGFDNWQEIQKHIEVMESNNFPVDGFALDLQWFGGDFYSPGQDTRGSRFGSLQFNTEAFPEPEQNIRRLQEAHGVEVMTIEESYISKFRPEHESLAQQHFLAHSCQSSEPTYLDSNPWWGVGGMIDWTNPAAADYWHDSKRDALTKLGIVHHWTDLGEPEMYDKNSCYFGFPELGKQRHADIHNVYNLKWLEGLDRGYRRHNNLRHFSLSRSGTSGVQRFAAGMWSGDIAANMGALTAQFNVQTNMTFSGIDYYGSDIGGFHRRPDTLDGDPNELYTQWFANSSLLDFPIRPHVWNLSNRLSTNPAVMGDKESNLANLRLRYHLFPYYYSLAHEAHLKGTPIVSPPELYFPGDIPLRGIGHQKMIGPALMVGIVAHYGENERDMYLPEGRWILYYTGASYQSRGETFAGIPTHYDHRFRPPLFLREGAIVPAMAVDRLTSNSFNRRRDGSQSHQLEIEIVPSVQPTNFTLYEDDGRTRDYEQGQLRTTLISQMIQGNNSARINISAAKGTYSGAAETRELVLQVYLPSSPGKSVLVNDHALAACRSSALQRLDNCWQTTGDKVNIYLTETSVHKDIGVQIGW